MIRVIVFGIILGIFLGEVLCMPMQIDYDYQKNYTETFTRAVGATTRTGVRGTLPQPAPSDSNVIHLATNGNDGTADGTAALPYLTLNAAIVALTAGKPTIHIFRNGAIGDLVFLETTYSTLPASRNIQSEQGEIGEIHFDENTTLLPAIRLNCAGTNQLNGVAFYEDDPDNADSTVFFGGSGSSLKSCSFYSVSDINAATTSANKVLFRYNYFEGLRFINGNTNDGLDVSNCIFNNTITPRTGGTPGDQNFNAQILIQAIAGAAGTLSINRSYFVGSQRDNTVTDMSVNNTSVDSIAIYALAVPGGPVTLDVDSCAFIATNNAIVSQDPTSAIPMTVNLNNCMTTDVTLSWAVPVGSPSTVIVVNSNDALPALPNLLIDENAALNGSIESFRLQRTGLTTLDGSGKYFLESPLVGTGVSSVDVNPFDESVTLATLGYFSNMHIDWPPTQFAMENRFGNASNLDDVNGNAHVDYDKKRRAFLFTWGDGTHLSNLQLKQFTDLLGDRGSKKFYPLGLGGNLFQDSGISAGTFSSVDNSFTPDAVVGQSLVNGYWAGFWINIGVDSYYISTNDASKFYLVDKLVAGFPVSGSYGFIVEHILVNIKVEPYVYIQSNFTEFTKGGSYRESSEDVRNYDYTIETITLVEVEDNEENA